LLVWLEQLIVLVGFLQRLSFHGNILWWIQ
jgi:hypothetical protein